MSATKTVAPSRASASAEPRPMPLAAPVTSAILLLSRAMCASLVELVELANIIAQDPGRFLDGQRLGVLAQEILTPGPGGIAVRKIIRPHQPARVAHIRHLER